MRKIIRIFERLTTAAEHTQVNNRCAKPEEMQMTGETSSHREQPLFLWPTMQSDVLDCARLGHGKRSLENEKIQNRKADHA